MFGFGRCLYSLAENFCYQQAGPESCWNVLIVLEIMDLTQSVVSIVLSKLWRRKASAAGTCEGAGCSDEEAT